MKDYDRPEHPADKPADRHPRQADARRDRRPLGRAVAGRRHLRVRSVEVSQRGLLDRHPTTHGVRLPACRPRLQLHPHRPSGPLPPACGASRCSTRWAGTTTASPPSAGCRTTTASAATPPSPTSPTSPHPPSPGSSTTPSRRTRSRSAAPTSSSCAANSSRKTRRSSRTSGAVSGSRSTGTTSTPRSTSAAGGRPSSRSSTTSPPATPTSSRPPACGTSASRPRWPRPSSRIGNVRARTTSSASPGPTAATSRSTPPAPELLAACVAVVAHPDDERYAPFAGELITTPLYGVEVPLVLHELADPEKGTGAAMVCTFGDLTDVTWWRDLDLPARPIIGRNGRFVAEAPDAITSDDGVARYGEIVGKTVHTGSEIVVEQLRAADQLIGRAGADHPPGQVLREGRQAPRDHHHPSVVHPQRRSGCRPGRGSDQAGRGDRVPPRLHAGPLPQLDRGPHRRLAHLPSTILRGPDPGVVPARRRRRTGLRRPARSRRRVAADRPVDRRSPGFHARPAGSARWVHRRPRRDGHLGDLVAHPTDRWRLARRQRPVAAGLPLRHATPGPRHHPDLAVLHGRPLPLRGAQHPLVQRVPLRLDPRPGPQEDEQVEGQRARPHRPARLLRVRRGSLLGCLGPAGAPTPRSTRGR